MLFQRKDAVSLFLISFLGLFYELAFIRWIAANILSFAFFTNIVLISCFLGIGLGCLLSSRSRDYFRWFPFMLVAAILIFLILGKFEVVVPHGSEWVWATGFVSTSSNSLKLGILPTLVIVFVVNAALFIPIGQKMAKLMEKDAPIRAYSINILGSLAGVAAFGLLSFIGGFLNSPELWFGISGLIALWFFIESRKLLLSACGCFMIVALLMGYSSKDDIWSPYYSIQLRPGEKHSFDLFVNRLFHQKMVDFNVDRWELGRYGIPYDLKAAKRVLILGAGTGNDAAVALARGATQIDAVEIDPMIVSIGRKLHPSNPYQDPKVRVIVNDARAFLKTTNDKYDLIIFGTLDSHALLSGMSTVRLDNYVYTLNCLKDAKKHLAPDGIMVLMFAVSVDWLGHRITNLCGAAFEDESPVAYLGSGDLFNLMVLAGPGVKPAFDNYSGDRSQFTRVAKVADMGTLPTDDWPYLYLKDKTIPGHYLKAVAWLSAVSIIAILALLPKGSRKIDLNFLSLGCAFMLLETKSVTTMSLLFGSTWLVNVFVFGGILLMILLANLYVLNRKIQRIEWVYLLLGLSLVFNYAVPMEVFLNQDFWLRSLVPAVFIALPLFFAGIIFAYHFSAARRIGWVFGSNLIGAVLGGFLEYSSMAVGLRFLYVIAGLFYLVSLLSYRGQSLPGGATKNLIPAGKV